ncbi:MAG: 30S ribosomal protein S12 methylthiotransferase RimO, partial [Planctomycetota bacterium]
LFRSRRVNQKNTEKQIDLMRKIIPDLVLRTTFITGFPGETDAQFQTLVNFVKRHQFERMGVFTYSYEPGTQATRIKGHLPDELKEARRAELMAVQQEVMFAYNERQLGQPIEVIIDQEVPDQPGAWIGRGHGDAPDVDSLVFVTETEDPIEVGDIVPCEVVAYQGYDLIAVATDVPSKRKAMLKLV